MRRTVITLAIAALAAPVAAFATDPASDQSSPAQVCKAQRKALGAAVFAATYGTNADRSNALGKCVSRQRKALKENREAAVDQCRAEQGDASFAASHGGKTFEQFYGTGKKGRNAFGKCVSAKVQAATSKEQHETIKAAKACKAERSADPVAFRQKYGTNKNKANAFGKCVSAKTGGP